MKLLQRKTNRHGKTATDQAAAIDLRTAATTSAVVERVLRWYPADFVLEFGAPTRCPDCGSYGMVDHVDHHRGFTANTCLACPSTWRINRDELRIEPTDSAEPFGGGILFRDVGAGTLGSFAGPLVSAN